MGMIKRGWWTLCLIFFSVTVYTQNNCVPTGLNNTVINSNCNQICRTLSVQVPDLRSSSDYEVISTPYNPFPFVTPGGTEDPILYNDDSFSGAFALPFPFCFYDQVYTSAVVGSNGLITFDVATNQSCNTLAGWNISTPLPSSSGIPCNSPTYYPKASIMGAFMDLDPSAGASPSDRKIEWRVEGTAPCRRFVVSYYRIGVYNNASCGLNRPTTFQMVMYESTGVIDVFINSKLCEASGGNGARAILGIQDENAVRFKTATGKNATVWSASNEGYRFVPSGGGSRFVSAELLRMDLSLVANATVANTTPGLLDISFPNVCSPAASTQYILRTTFSACDNAVTQLVSLDTITVNQLNNLTGTISSVAASCPGIPNGSISVNGINGSGNYDFVLMPGNILQTGPTASFTGLVAGPYSVTVTDNASGVCVTTPSLTTTIASGAGPTATTSTTPTSCNGQSNGTITVNPTGNGPFTYTIDGGAATIAAPSFTFTGLSSGPHTIRVTDVNGCTTSADLIVSVPAGPALTTTATHTDVGCNGDNSGTITVTSPTTGVAPYEYSLDGAIWQNTNVFNSLPAGNYTVFFRDNGGCQGQLTVVVAEPTLLTATATSTNATCFGQSNGTITVTTTGGVAPYQYSVNGGTTWQNANVINVGAGNYTVIIRDANLCTTTQTVTINQPVAVGATWTSTPATCNGGNDGSVTLTATGGNGNFQYSLDGGSTFGTNNVFPVIPGTYTGTIRDDQGCLFTVPNIIVGIINDLTYTAPAPLTICEGSSTQLDIVTNAIQFAWTPAATLSNPSIRNPVASPAVTTDYTVTISYGLCSADVPVRVNVRTAPVPDAGPPGFICFGQTYQLQGSGGVNYSWSPADLLDNPTAANPVASPRRTTEFLLNVEDANGCPSLVPGRVTVDVTPPIRVNTYPADTVVYEGDQFQLLATSEATDYLWTPATGLSDPTIENPVFTAGVAGDVNLLKVVASTQAGCQGEGFITIRVYKGPELYTPTAFTPNGDGRNDKFFPFPVGIRQLNYFRVYNRWGQLLYSTNTLNDGWDGRAGGNMQGSGVYIWMAEGTTLDNRKITKKGTVTLIR